MDETKGSKILIVDDSATNIQLLASILNEHYELKVATSGKRCLELVSKSPKPDLILLDIEMPDMNGYEVCRELKKLSSSSTIPIIFVTAKSEDSDEELGLALGAVDYITKPIKPAIVKARVKTQLIIKHQRDQLVKMALHDQLTGLYNRHYLLESAHIKISKSMRHKTPVSLTVIDLDHFKHINDTYGHKTGDLALKAIADLLKSVVRKEDIAARFGGEEFVVIFDHCDLKDALRKAEDLRKAISQLKPKGLDLTASFGVAQLDSSGESFDQLLNRSDKALYLAKEQGRNRVVSL